MFLYLKVDPYEPADSHKFESELQFNHFPGAENSQETRITTCRTLKRIQAVYELVLKYAKIKLS